MQSKKVFLIGLMMWAGFAGTQGVRAADVIVDEEIVDVDMEQMSADAVAAYQVDGSLFQQITDLEQEKVLMQLEKERAQLDLELDRLAAEKIKLHMEIDTLSGRAEQQQQEIETQKAKLEAEAARIEREKESWLAAAEERSVARTTSLAKESDEETAVDITKNYRLVNVVGAGAQLQATVEDLSSGQSKRVSVGKTLDGFTVKSISLYDGIVFVGPDGATQTLNVSNGK
ncbi:MAG: type IV pilus biogenesis protein PilP [Alphaproteobacteria bacterium]|nr:type IV pilus biogenesis protein PilP [Alphaproteobacteria bacterium]